MVGIAKDSVVEIEAKELSVVLGGHKVLEIPLLRVNSHEVLIFVGPNGSGKTTLLLSLALLLKPAKGTIFYRGVSVLGANQVLRQRRKIAVVFQEPLLLNSTVWNNVTLGLQLRGLRGDEVKKMGQKWLERFGITHLAKRQARTLSGGEAKRVSLARAFVLQPEVLFLDEPFNALDSPTRQGLLEDFESVLIDTKVTTVMVTHDRNEALALADRVAVLMAGSIKQVGVPEEVFGSPVDDEVAGFIEAGNILHGVVGSQNNGLVSIQIGEQQLHVVSNLSIGSQVTAYLHYEDVTISLPSAEEIRTSARNQMKGKIVKIFPLGSQLKVTLDCGFTLAAVITRRSWEDLGLEIGREIIASFKASAVHLMPHR